MAKLSKGYRGYVSNDPSTDEWIKRTGQLLINFGTVEMQTYFWLEALSDDENEVIVASKKQFSWRLNRVRKLIHQSDIEPTIKNEMLKIWGHSEELSKFRNKIAHNPLIFSFKGREAEGKPDQIGIPSFRKSKRDQQPFTIVGLCSLKKLKLAVDALFENASNLSDMYDEQFG